MIVDPSDFPLSRTPTETMIAAQRLGDLTEPVPRVPLAVSPLSALLLKIADKHRRERSFRQAIDVYFELIDRYPETSESEAAQAALLQIGENYERAGELRQARSVYERLF